MRAPEHYDPDRHVTLSFRMEGTLAEQLRKMAADNERSLGAEVRLAIMQRLQAPPEERGAEAAAA